MRSKISIIDSGHNGKHGQTAENSTAKEITLAQNTSKTVHTRACLQTIRWYHACIGNNFTDGALTNRRQKRHLTKRRGRCCRRRLRWWSCRSRAARWGRSGRGCCLYANKMSRDLNYRPDCCVNSPSTALRKIVKNHDGCRCARTLIEISFDVSRCAGVRYAHHDVAVEAERTVLKLKRVTKKNIWVAAYLEILITIEQD